MSKIEVNTIEPQCGTTLTLGASGDTVTLASGASQSGFGRTGTVDWDTTPKTTGSFTAVSGTGYFLNTAGGVITANLPAGSAGAIVSFSDYSNTWQTSKVTVTPNGSEKINGASGGNSAFLNTEGQSVTLVYIDGTQGWKTVQDSTADVTGAGNYIIASGGTPSTSGDYKIHTFTGPGTFTVTCSGPGSLGVDYLVVAGGGGGGGSKPGYHSGGGGGAGGFRESVPSPAAWTASPIAAPGNARPVSVQAYPITVGGGGPGGTGGPGPSNTNGTVGNTSTFSDISSAGGGYGGLSNAATSPPGGNGGSGGGGGGSNPGSPNIGGTGNTPPVSPAQGFNGGVGSTPTAGTGGGGGGALGVGVDGLAQPYGKAGGPGATTHISGSPVVYAIGGASGTQPGVTPTTPVNSGTGGQSGGDCASNGAAGGSGIVILRYKFQN